MKKITALTFIILISMTPSFASDPSERDTRPRSSPTSSSLGEEEEFDALFQAWKSVCTSASSLWNWLNQPADEDDVDRGEMYILAFLAMELLGSRGKN